MVQHFRQAPSSIVAELQLHKAGGTRKYVTFSYTSDVVQKAYTDTDMPSQSFATTTFDRSTRFIRRQKFRQINLLHNNQFRNLSVLSNDKPKHWSSTIRTEVHFLLHKKTHWIFVTNTRWLLFYSSTETMYYRWNATLKSPKHPWATYLLVTAKILSFQEKIYFTVRDKIIQIILSKN
jgi:hypothetical protein